MKAGRTLIPWGMAAGRAALGPVMIVGARAGWNGMAMAAIVVAALLSDIFDGVLARRWKCDTAAVRLFDSMADTIFYSGVGIAVWVGRRAVLREDAGLVAALVGLELVRYAVEFARFGKPASYHSYLAKTWGLVMACAMIAVFAGSHGAGWLAAAMVVGLGSNLEGLAMSCVMPEWRKDVKGLRAALEIRRKWLLLGKLGGSVFPNSEVRTPGRTASVCSQLLH